MEKPKKRKHTLEVKPKPLNCANCHLSCSPDQMSHLTDPLPSPDIRSRPKKRKVSNVNGDHGTGAAGSINETLASVFFFHDPGLAQTAPGLCPNCSLVLGTAWRTMNKFRQRAFAAPTSFLAPYLCQVKVPVLNNGYLIT